MSHSDHYGHTFSFLSTSTNPFPNIATAAAVLLAATADFSGGDGNGGPSTTVPAGSSADPFPFPEPPADSAAGGTFCPRRGRVHVLNRLPRGVGDGPGKWEQQDRIFGFRMMMKRCRTLALLSQFDQDVLVSRTRDICWARAGSRRRW